MLYRESQILRFSLCREILAEESNVQRVEFPVTVSKLWVLNMVLKIFCLGLWRHSWTVL